MVLHQERISRELVYQGSILDIYKDIMKLPNGKTEEWDYVAHRMGAAAILPVLDNGKLLLIRQYRNALERETLEIPAGCRDSLGEDTKITATRELEEETGYKSNHVEFLLSLRTTVAFCNESIDVYLATDLTKGTMHLDEAESIELVEITLEDATALIYSGKIQDSKTVAAIMAYANKIK